MKTLQKTEQNSVSNPDTDAIRNRLKAYISYTGLTQAAFARKCGFPANSLSMFLTGDQDSFKPLITLPYYCDINLNWLYSGKGTMTVNDPQPTPSAPTVSIESSKYLDIACLDNIMNRAQEIIDMKPIIVEGEEPDWRKLFFEQMAYNQKQATEMAKILGQLELYKHQAIKIHRDLEELQKELTELKSK